MYRNSFIFFVQQIQSFVISSLDEWTLVDLIFPHLFGCFVLSLLGHCPSEAVYRRTRPDQMGCSELVAFQVHVHVCICTCWASFKSPLSEVWGTGMVGVMHVCSRTQNMAYVDSRKRNKWIYIRGELLSVATD